MIDSEKYLDVLKVLELAAEGGGETLYRLLPYGATQFVWRTYGNSIGEDEAGEETWEDFSNEYESLTEYLIDRNSMLAALYPLHVDAAFRSEIFMGFFNSVRNARSISPTWLFGETSLFGNWPQWQKLLQLSESYDKIELYSTFTRNPIEVLQLDPTAISSAQHLLNVVYNALLIGVVPQHSYGRRWKLYDLVKCRELNLPHDDRDDSLRQLGITGGGKWVVYEVE